VVGDTFDDVDELDDLVALERRRAAALLAEDVDECPHLASYFYDLRATHHWWRAHHDQPVLAKVQISLHGND